MIKIDWEPRAVKHLVRLPRRLRIKIASAVNVLGSPKSARDVFALNSHKFYHQMRVGKYQIIFEIDRAVRILSIEHVRKPDEKTH